MSSPTDPSPFRDRASFRVSFGSPRTTAVTLALGLALGPLPWLPVSAAPPAAPPASAAAKPAPQPLPEAALLGDGPLELEDLKPIQTTADPRTPVPAVVPQAASPRQEPAPPATTAASTPAATPASTPATTPASASKPAPTPASTALLPPAASVAPLPGRELILDRRRKLLRVVQDGKELRRFPVAVGMPGWETPQGRFTVIEKTADPTWEHPASGRFYPPGPANPLGSRWIGFHRDCYGRRGFNGQEHLEVKGCVTAGFHGTPNRASIGQAVSHGCVRLFDEHARELFDLVQMGTPVTVLP